MHRLNIMKRFLTFINEEHDSSEAKLKHLEHLEDHPINAGHEGTHHALSNLLDMHRKLRGRNNDTKNPNAFDLPPSQLPILVSVKKC